MKPYIFLFVVACTSQAQTSKPPTKFDGHRSEVNGWLDRFENDEVICYGRYDWGLQCKFKETK